MQSIDFNTLLAECEVPDGFWGLLKKGFSLYFRNFGTIALITLIAFVPVEAIVSYGTYYLNKQDDAVFVMRVANVVYLIVGSLVSPAVCVVALHSLAKKRMPVFKALAFGISRFFSVLAATFATNLIIGIGMLLLIVPGVIFYTWYALVVPAASLDDGLTMGSLGKSKELTKGVRASFFGLGCIIVVLIVVLLFVVGVALTVPFSYVGISDLWWSDALNAIISDVSLSLFPVIYTVFYINRMKKFNETSAQVA